ncbi:MAG: pyridoxamine 5'-phosphate oxidase family protein [Woeseiaceae bacterium]|nr:pyridoxamine 5'-phosphate oxidase family protein [Woeseiaceae bacterium]
MTKAEREAFLAEVHVGVISIERDGAAPLAVPIWYDYAPDQGVWVLTEPGSQKGQALEAAGRYSLCAQIEEPPGYRYVSVSGPIVEVRPADLEKDSRPMAHRYFGAELGDWYVENNPSASNVYLMRPERWWTVDYRKLGPVG